MFENLTSGSLYFLPQYCLFIYTNRLNIPHLTFISFFTRTGIQSWQAILLKRFTSYNGQVFVTILE